MDEYTALDKFKDQLQWALTNVSDFGQRQNYTQEAEQKWENYITPEDRAQFAKLIMRVNEALDYATDAAMIGENLERNGDWTAKWSNLLASPVNDLSDEQVNELQAFARVQESYIFCLQTLCRAYSDLAEGYIKYQMEHIFKRLWDDHAMYKAYCELWMPRIQQIKNHCAKPEFEARIVPSRQVKSTSVVVEEDGDIIWTQARNLAPSKDEKLWLWVAFDRAGNLVDRYVLKREEMSHQRWNDASFWKIRDDGSTVPKEYYLQNACWERDNNGFVLVRACTWAPRVIDYKIAYCPFGDLMDLHEVYRDQSVPEPVLWYIFEKLAQACVAMEDVSSDPTWLQVVHRDIKPENVFLDLPHPNYFPAYPAAKLADFGLAFETHPADGGNPYNWRDSGTPPFLAPEQKVDIDCQGPDGRASIEKMLSHTNVWAIGLVMLEFVNATPLGDQKQYVRGVPSYYHTDERARAQYSQELLRLIESYMEGATNGDGIENITN
ncbi:hypothetical protein CERZMDRAFT_83350 [Cercospora zeae-maydis SCOH1-5]|uniref:non-specific serine/threonine protein kinase n=1 Tax=Cercospora zeae-maydis SCOH1-5 TaxID=717836 RepID=A0A6A6FKG3_9PEZI|nr:hypothetical protein CERZMDRAFT_83350 [Cercospora zeae-maydis SCOH1-5]